MSTCTLLRTVLARIRYFRLGGPPCLVHGKISDVCFKTQRFNPTKAYFDV